MLYNNIMEDENIPHPPIVDRATFDDARAALLAEEKWLTKQKDRINALRRRLPMVKMEKDYRFQGPDGDMSFADLFDGTHQLIMYHFMFGPTQEVGCPVCTGYMKELGDLSKLRNWDARFITIGRAPYAKLAAHREASGFHIPFYSSLGSDFNFDFEVSDERGEGQGISVFFRIGEDVYLTYLTRQRGVEGLVSYEALLDITPFGRQLDFEDSPPGWPQRPTYG